MDPNWGKYWATARKMGLPAFLLKRGTMLGLIMFGLLVVLPRVFKMVDSQELPIGAFILFMALGYGFAYLLWWANERSYGRLNDDSEDSNPQGPTDD